MLRSRHYDHIHCVTATVDIVGMNSALNIIDRFLLGVLPTCAAYASDPLMRIVAIGFVYARHLQSRHTAIVIRLLAREVLGNFPSLTADH
jgi:hypothetical protein